jgi:RNA:NAD 2'-phosphotransferase (TPT1/KptA family)
MPAKASTFSSSTLPAVFERYSRALVMHTAAFLLRHYALTMSGLHLDEQAVAYLEEEAHAVEQQMDEQSTEFLPATVPVLFESYSRVLMMHTAAFLLRHYVITMHGLHLDPEAVAFLEEEAHTVEQQMDHLDVTFPDVLDVAVLELLRALVATGGR